MDQNFESVEILTKVPGSSAGLCQGLEHVLSAAAVPAAGGEVPQQCSTRLVLHLAACAGPGGGRAPMGEAAAEARSVLVCGQTYPGMSAANRNSRYSNNILWR